jgi:hypothetical protein
MNPGQPMQAPRIHVVRGPHFSYALPEGWVVAEEGSHALMLRAQDGNAGILVSGVSGLTSWMTPEQFVQMKMPQLAQSNGVQMYNLQTLAAQPCRPLAGYNAASIMQLSWTAVMPQETRQVRGVAISNVANVYARCDATMTLASSKADLWDYFGGWLPQVAEQAVNIGPDAYGRDRVNENDVRNADRERETFVRTQEVSRQAWVGVQEGRDSSFNMRQGDTSLTGQGWFTASDGQAAQRLSFYQTHWKHRDGRIVSFDDPSKDPNTPTDLNWTRMQVAQSDW